MKKKIQIIFVILFLSSFVMQAQNLMDNFTFEEASGTFSSISTTGTKIPLTAAQYEDGDYTLDLASSGFSFAFCGQNYSSMSVNVNGAIQLGGTGFNSHFNFIEGTAGQENLYPLLAPLWDDLDFIDYTGEGLYYQLTGSGNEQILTIEWNNIAHINHHYDNNRVTFQLKLFEETGIVEFVYGDMDSADNWGTDCTASIGINNGENGTITYQSVTPGFPEAQVSNSTPNNTISNSKISSISSGITYRFTYVAPDCVHYTLAQNNIGVDSETAGVAVADFNGDGNKDVVIVDAYDDIEVYFYDADFGEISTTGVSYGGDERWRWGVNAIDIDNDGDMDFVTVPFTYSSDYGLEIYENDGAGNFTLKTDQLAKNTRGEKLVIGDLNNDGFDDIFYPTKYPKVFINDGSGNFTNTQTFDICNGSQNAALKDFDNDGDLDVVIVRDGSSSFVTKIFFNDGTGQFTDSGQELTAYGIEGVDAGDIDGDGDIDIVLAPSSTGSPLFGSPVLWLNDGLGTFLPGDTLFQISASHNKLVLADQNFDGYLDIFTDKCILLNDKNNPGHFSLHETFTESTHDIDVTDMNNDGLLDIYMGRFSSSAGDNVYICDTPTLIEEDEIMCFGDSIKIAGIWQKQAGIYYENIDCGSLKKINLTVYDEINTEITENNGTLTVAEANAEYQWLDCNDNNNPISGANSQSYTPSISSNYSVEITKNGTCTNTSACYNLVLNYTLTFTVTNSSSIPLQNVNININANDIQTNTSGIATIDLSNETYSYTASLSGYDNNTGSITIYDASENVNIVMQETIEVNRILENEILIYPNPTNGIFTIKNQEASLVVERNRNTRPSCVSNIEITDITGKIINNSQLTINNLKIDISNFPNGIYFVKIILDKNIIIKKIIKN